MFTQRIFCILNCLFQESHDVRSKFQVKRTERFGKMKPGWGCQSLSTNIAKNQLGWKLLRSASGIAAETRRIFCRSYEYNVTISLVACTWKAHWLYVLGLRPALFCVDLNKVQRCCTVVAQYYYSSKCAAFLARTVKSIHESMKGADRHTALHRVRKERFFCTRDVMLCWVFIWKIHLQSGTTRLRATID